MADTQTQDGLNPASEKTRTYDWLIMYSVGDQVDHG
jgi:hypothetical protein